MRVFITRHGESEWNQLGLLQGRFDSHLSTHGQHQAKALSKQVKNLNIQVVATSPLQRAKHTAETCQQACNSDLIVIDQLSERDFGVWQGKKIVELEQQHGLFSHPNTSIPEAEEPHICSERFHQALIELNQQYGNKNVLVVSHGEVIRNFMHFALKLEKSIILDNCQVIELTLTNNGFQLVDSL